MGRLPAGPRPRPRAAAASRRPSAAAADGVRWRAIDNPQDLRFWSIAAAGDGTVYAGASGDLGFLEPESAGRGAGATFCFTLARAAAPPGSTAGGADRSFSGAG